jgi:hypothetical protein
MMSGMGRSPIPLMRQQWRAAKCMRMANPLRQMTAGVLLSPVLLLPGFGNTAAAFSVSGIAGTSCFKDLGACRRIRFLGRR